MLKLLVVYNHLSKYLNYKHFSKSYVKTVYDGFYKYFSYSAFKENITKGSDAMRVDVLKNILKERDDIDGKILKCYFARVNSIIFAYYFSERNSYILI